jgi:hypothetical protein
MTATLRQTERRSFPRFPCPLETYCRPCSVQEDELWYRGEIWDMSVAGVGLILTRAFEAGCNLEMEMPLPSIGALVVHVEYITKQVDGSWFLGCTFLDRIEESTVQSILQMASAATKQPEVESVPS